MKKVETITLAGGCFWCTEAIFKRLKGVISALPGYAGGSTVNPTYEDVCSGKTGHAEAIQIDLDPAVISLDKVLDVFWNTHNPTTRNRQGNDIGEQYRSVIFYSNVRQKNTAQKSKKRFEKEGIYKDPIVTQIIPFTSFYPAENYHKNYFDNNKNTQYCNIVINPKINKLIQKFTNDVKEEYRNEDV